MKAVISCFFYLTCALLINAGLSWQSVQATEEHNREDEEGYILIKKVNKNYPPWYRGCGKGYESDDCAHHYYYEYIGPRSGGFTPEQGKFVDSNRMYCGTFYMKSGKTYPSHSHPAREMYYIMEGTADWYTGDTKKAVQVKPGTFIYHPPYTPHGWAVTSDTTLEAFYCWWVEGEDDIANKTLSKGGRLTNPCRDQSPQTVKAYRENIAECAGKPAALANLAAADCGGGTCSGSDDKLTCPGPTCGVAEPELACKYGETDLWGEIKVACKNDCLNSCLNRNGTDSMYDRAGGVAAYYFPEQQISIVFPQYLFTEYIGEPDKDKAVTPFIASHRASCGTLEMEPGAVYPEAVRRINEFMYIMQGTADWYSGSQDKTEKVGAGTFLYHPPNVPHGWKVTSKESLKAFYCRWIEDDANLNKRLLSQESD